MLPNYLLDLACWFLNTFTGDVVACSSKLPLVHRLLFCLSRFVLPL